MTTTMMTTRPAGRDRADSVLISDWLEGAVVAVAPPPSSSSSSSSSSRSDVGNDGGGGEFRAGSMKTVCRRGIGGTDSFDGRRFLLEAALRSGIRTREDLPGRSEGQPRMRRMRPRRRGGPDDDDAGRRRLAGAVSDMIRRRDAAGVLPVEDRGESLERGAVRPKTKTTTTTQQSNSAREREGLTMTVVIGSWWLAMLTMIDGNGDRP